MMNEEFPDQVWRRTTEASADPHDRKARKPDILRELVSASELIKNPPSKPRALVEGHIHAGETGLLVGRPKVGKSRLALQLALNISQGVPFLNQPVGQKFRVLLLDLENRAHAVGERLKAMSPPEAQVDSDSPAAEITIYAPDRLAQNRLSLTDEVGFYQLQEILDYAMADILIIDTWRLLSAQADENRAEHVVAALTRLSRLREAQPNLVMLLLHHLRKRDLQSPVSLRTDPYTWVEAVSGHHALVGHVDFCWGLDREVDAKGNEAIVFGGVSRNAASSTILLDEDPDTLLFTPADAQGQQLQQILTPRELKFWGVAKVMQEFTFGELADACRTKTRKTIASLLRKAQAHGLIARVGERYKVLG